MNRFADLHAHTNYSDGTCSPYELVQEAAVHGVSAIAVTDHDTVEGVEMTLQEAAGSSLEVIPAIELTAEYEGREVHILGYLIDHKDENLQQALAILKERRIERVYAIAEKLQAMGLRLDVAKVFALSGHGTVGRMHIARAMEQQKLITNTAEAFQKYIGDEGPAYVCGFRFSAQEAIGLIKSVGGVAVIAHPYTLKQDEWIHEFIRLGVQGLEVYYPEHSQSMTNYYRAIAEKYGLAVTGGSDFHGNAKPSIKLGCMKVPYELVEKLRQVQAQ